MARSMGLGEQKEGQRREEMEDGEGGERKVE